MNARQFFAATLVCLLLAGCRPARTDTPEVVFLDVPGDQVWGGAIAHICADGYMHGKGEGAFDPHAPLTRAEAAVLLLRVKNGIGYQPADHAGEWWERWVHEAEAEGLMDAIQDPEAPATRADIATLVWLLEP